MVKVIEKEVCIVGSGFCGYAAYNNFKSKNINLVLIEGGEIETPKSIAEQPFYAIRKNKFLSIFEGKKIKNNLDISFRDRKFTLGGSSACWSGWIKPFEESSFKNCFSDIYISSWGEIDLLKYEEDVLKFLNSPISNFSKNKVLKKFNISLPKLSTGLDYTLYAWAKSPLRLKNFWKEKILIDKKKSLINKEIICGYKLVKFRKTDNKISEFIFESKDQKIIVVKAKFFILAMGGIENGRFVHKLFENKNLIKKNIRINNFQEHPHLYGIASFNKGKNKLPNILIDRKRIFLKNESLNEGFIKFSMTAWDGPGTPKVSFEIEKNRKNFNFKNLIKNYISHSEIKKSKNLNHGDYIVHMRCEQTPNNKSKLVFEDKNNSLEWDIKDSDFISYSNYLKRFAAYLYANNFATDFILNDMAYKNHAIPREIDGGAHHMGTVPYLKDESLIDAKFRLKEYKNIYVVGSSAFPTSGFENPTHNSMAIALAASDHIMSKID